MDSDSYVSNIKLPLDCSKSVIKNSKFFFKKVIFKWDKMTVLMKDSLLCNV